MSGCIATAAGPAEGGTWGGLRVHARASNSVKVAPGILFHSMWSAHCDAVGRFRVECATVRMWRRRRPEAKQAAGAAESVEAAEAGAPEEVQREAATAPPPSRGEARRGPCPRTAPTQRSGTGFSGAEGAGAKQTVWALPHCPSPSCCALQTGLHLPRDASPGAVQVLRCASSTTSRALL